MTILDLFDIRNPEHIAAYWHLVHKGQWPAFFWPDGTLFTVGWQHVIEARMAHAYVAMKLGEAAFSTETLRVAKSDHMALVEDLLESTREARATAEGTAALHSTISTPEWVDAFEAEFSRVFGKTEFKVGTARKRLAVYAKPTTWGEPVGYDPRLAVPILQRFADGYATDGAEEGERDKEVCEALGEAQLDPLLL